MIPQPIRPTTGADLDRGVRRRWRERRLTGRPSEPADPTAAPYVIQAPALRAAGPVDAGRVALHVVVDVVARHRAMLGARVERVLGWDDHHPAVPADGRETTVAAHIADDERVRHVLGCDGGAVDDVRTAEPTYVDSVWWTVAQLWEAGLLREVPTTTRLCEGCGTSVDGHAVTVHDGASTTAVVRFPVRGDAPLCTSGASLLVTVHDLTTLSAVRALTATPGTDLVLARAHGDAYPVVLARRTVAAVLGHDAIVHRDVGVDEIVGLRCRHPLTSVDVDVDMDDSDGPASTTGLAVHPPRGQPGEGVDDPVVLDTLAASGLLFRVGDRRDGTARCGTCGGRVVDRPGRAWAVRTSRITDRLVTGEASVTRRSLAGEAPAQRGDPSAQRISRAGPHGIPLPLWRCDACGTVTAVSGRARLAALVDCDVDDLDVRDGTVVAAAFACRACDGGTARHVALVTDRFVDTGALPFARFGFPALPGSDARVARRCHADVVVDPSGAAADAMLTVASLLWDAGSHDAAITIGGGGAVVDVERVCARHGADAVRWAAVTGGSDWLAGCDAVAGVAAETLVTPLLDACTSFEKAAADASWTAADVTDVADVTARPVWDRWILAELADTAAMVRHRLDESDVVGAARRVQEFLAAIGLWRTHRTAEPDASAERDGASALATLHECLVTVAALLAPFTPFLSDELFERLVRSGEPVAPDTVHLLRYPVPHAAARDDDLCQSMRTDHDRGLRVANDVIRAVNELRLKDAVHDGDPIAVRIDADAEVAAAVETHRRTVADGVLASRIELGPIADGVRVPLDGAPARLEVWRIPR